MWILIAGAGAVVVCAASWWRAGRTRPEASGHRVMSETEKDALNRAAMNQGQRGGFGGAGGIL
jgi:hypothetical protein